MLLGCSYEIERDLACAHVLDEPKEAVVHRGAPGVCWLGRVGWMCRRGAASCTSGLPCLLLADSGRW